MPHKVKRFIGVQLFNRLLKRFYIVNKIFPAVFVGNKAKLDVVRAVFRGLSYHSRSKRSPFRQRRKNMVVPVYIFAHTVHNMKYALNFTFGYIYKPLRV